MAKIENYKDKFPLLHAIRGVAAMYVVVYHTKFILWSGGTEYLLKNPRETWSILDYMIFGFDLLTTAGSQMVMVFFVLSGFFIALSLENARGSFLQRLKLFYLVRFTRIYIPYIASIVAGVAVLLWIQYFVPELYQSDSQREFNTRLITAYNNLDLANFLKSMLFLKNKEYIGFNFAYWSLLYEGIFYLTIPFLFQRKTFYLLASAMLFFCGIYLNAVGRPSHILLKFLFEYNFYFALGQFIYIYKEQILTKFENRNYKNALLIAALVLFLVFDVLALMKQHFWSGIVSGISVSCMIIVFLKYDFRKTVLIRGIIKLGEISYSLYLIHIPVLVFIYSLVFWYTREFVLYNRIWYVTGGLVSIVAGILLYRTVEKPSMKIISLIKKKYKK